jgi:hypothetical protein
MAAVMSPVARPTQPAADLADRTDVDPVTDEVESTPVAATSPSRARRRAVWLALALVVAVLAMALVPSTSIESVTESSGAFYRKEWSCPTFGDIRVTITGRVPEGIQLKSPCASQAESRRLIVLVGVPVSLLVVGMMLLARRAEKRRGAQLSESPAGDSGDEPASEGAPADG